VAPQAFIAKWRASSKDESRHAHSHFNDLCALLGVPDPATAADPGFTFEKGAAKSTGGQGWADVWRKGCFGWEYKSYGRPLGPAKRDLLKSAFTDPERLKPACEWLKAPFLELAYWYRYREFESDRPVADSRQ
jgi:hypothetical protein